MRVLRSLAGVLLLLLGGIRAQAAAPMAIGADHALVVTAHALATSVGVEILRQGGNVADAAVAVGYALAVVYPAAGNLGGGGFMTLRFANGRTTFIDFREKAPLAARADMFLDAQGAVVPGRSTDTWLAVGVPGTVAGLEAVRERYGSLSRDRLLAPAIGLARDGFVLSQGDAIFFRSAADGLGADPAARAIFMPEGRVLAAGDRLRQPDLARTLDAIRQDGAKALYGGPLGHAMAAASAAGGGLITDKDFEAYAVREIPTIECSYRGYQVHSAPPPSSGGVTLCEILNIAEGFDIAAAGFHSTAEVHDLTEAMRHGYADRNTTLGDPAFVHNPVEHLVDKAYAARVRASILPDVAGRVAAPPARDAERPQTTHYSIADAAGNAIAVTTTLNGWFGAKRVAAGTGVLMNNEMDDFTARPGSPNMFGLVQGTANAIAPGKTPLSSMCPTILDKDGRLVMVLGSPGGSRIITSVAETIVNVIDHGMTLPEAIAAPRFHMQGQPDAIATEPYSLSPDTEAALVRQGYRIAPSDEWGMVAAIMAGAPRIGARPAGAHALSMTDAAGSFALYGAEDVRSRTGAAAGY